MSTRETFDKHELGRAVLDHLAHLLARGLAARDRSDPRRFIDVDYRAFVADPMATAERIYAYFSLPLSDATAAALRRHVVANPQSKHGRHDYSLDEYGLTPVIVRDRLASYIARFSL
jgi:hypothetical protein